MAPVIIPVWNETQALCSLRSPHWIHSMTTWRMVCLLTWTPGVKEQDELDPPRSSQGQGVAANRCVGGRADRQGHHVSRRTGDSGAPAGSVDVGGQTEGGPGALLLRGMRTCMWQWILRVLHVWCEEPVKYVCPIWERKLTNAFPKPMLNLVRISGMFSCRDTA